jgi:hypothetical protein
VSRVSRVLEVGCYMIHIQLLVTTTSVLVGSAFQPRLWSFYCSNAFDYAVPAAAPYECLTTKGDSASACRSGG